MSHVAKQFRIFRKIFRSASRFTASNIQHVSTENDFVKIKWEDKHGKFPHLFLRENCQCPNCFHPDSKQRLINTVRDIDLHIQASEVVHDFSENKVRFVWPDGHESVFTSDWMRERVFPESTDKIKSNTVMELKPYEWDGSLLNSSFPKFNFNEVISDDLTLKEFLEGLVTKGIGLIQDAPRKPGTLESLTPRIALTYFRKTYRGDTFQEINSPSVGSKDREPDIPLHSDLLYYNYQPGVQMLHCIEQCLEENAGAHMFVDGVKVVEMLKSNEPDAFNVLTSVKFTFEKVDEESGDYDFKCERPIINLDYFGNLKTIAHDQSSYSSFINASAQDVLKAYQAYVKLIDIIQREEMKFEYKMQPGEIVVFNNRRVLNGRRNFSLAESRFFEGGFVDWDEVFSALRETNRRIEN